LTYSKVTAPLSGRVGLRSVDVGNIIRASDANGLVTIAQLQPIAVFFTIPADDLPPVLRKLRAGAKLPVYAYDKDDVTKIATGTLLTVDNQIDPQTGTSRLKAEFANTDLALFPNQFVNCRMLLETRRGLTLIPAQAVQRGPQGTFVFLAENGTARMRPIEVEVTEAGDTAIAGVRAGELVITEGQDKLIDGMKIDMRQGGPRGSRGKGGWGKGGQGGQGGGGQAAPATGGPGTAVVPGPGATRNPNENAGPAPSKGWGQGRDWKGPGEGSRPPRGQGEGRPNR
jgi:multidrug efflux system membrane fusion protein